MNDFTASNGITVTDHGGNWDVTTIHFTGEVLGLAKNRTHEREMAFEDRDLLALREFFQAEADERLGRWRWPENPDYVVYPDRLNTTPPLGSVRVWNEKTGVSRYYLNRDAVDGIGGQFDPAADAYFDAHPEPKPWQNAEPGEVWALTLDGTEGVFLHAGGAWYGQGDMRVVLGHPIRDANVTAGRRIWPEASA